ncbi:MAG: type I-U CRISPR-associated helicase/endonuclease Cas3, partial [Verrucomicrobiae bacterium]|nr:type I-U CRISPR-associated helicase/endonuclease Cas3 [Verrucomicrobiae bacterium]
MLKFPTFAEFFRELWTYDPFPWQVRLTNELCAGGEWPEWVTLPTGTGKTSCIDIAIYHLASQAHQLPSQRSAPVRIVFAVYRRIVVDEAFERAREIGKQLADALKTAAHPLHPVASALALLAGDDSASPLDVYPLRGGTFTNHAWARTPTQPLVLTTTLDQLGSRLLFRGYGVSEYARPLHAALLANDALLILDEAHTSRPFSQTLRAITQFRAHAAEDLRTPFHSVQLTATPPASAGENSFGLDAKDNENATISRRINAAKPTTLLPVVDGAKGKSRHAAMAKEVCAKAQELIAAGTPRLLIVVNRVVTAETIREALEALAKKKGANQKLEIKLLTGRLRPLDRERRIAEINQWFPKDNASMPESSLILVATQCIEVGADYDFDALLTELAPLDSLRQRFGRLNRTGRNIAGFGFIFTPEDALDSAKPDPLYADVLPRVWNYLNGMPDLDFGISGLGPKLPKGGEIEPLLSPMEDAPVLMPAHLDLLCQTSPAPHAEPEVSLYIHGPQRSLPEVYVVQRADLDRSDQTKALLEAVPPLSTEAATLPIYLIAELLTDEPADDNGGDVAGEAQPSSKHSDALTTIAWRYRDGKASLITSIRDVRSGDFIVVSATTESDDQYELAYLTAKDMVRIRFTPAVAQRLGKLIAATDDTADLLEVISGASGDGNEESAGFDAKIWKDLIRQIAPLISANIGDDRPEKIVWQHAAKLRPDRWRAVPLPAANDNDPDGVIFEHPDRANFTRWPIDEDALRQSLVVARDEVVLDDHNRAVSARAARNASDLPDSIIAALRDAGLWHDLGKADPRFQAMLRGLPIYAAARKTQLAKSSDGFRPPHVVKVFREQAALPEGFRHELLSTIIVAQSAVGQQHPERELLLHLIASHHGRCRALAPVVPDSAPVPFTVSVAGQGIEYSGNDCPLAHMKDGVARRFWSLTRRFGWWGLPYLETNVVELRN